VTARAAGAGKTLEAEGRADQPATQVSGLAVHLDHVEAGGKSGKRRA
jgi:hypothetical protein